MTPSLTDSECRRVLFYSHDGTGLGHLRITLGVATAYAKLRPQDSLLLLTGSLQASSFEFPTTWITSNSPPCPSGIFTPLCPRPKAIPALITARFDSGPSLRCRRSGLRPTSVVVDHAPAGLFRELAPSIDWLRSREEPASLALLMRDITFGPEQTRTIWENEGVYPLLDEAYDQILIYGDRRVFDPVNVYAMSPQAAKRTRFCGYLAPSPPRRTTDQVREELNAGEIAYRRRLCRRRPRR